MVSRDILDRFRRDLDALVPAHTRIGVGVSGGPDSLALLLLAAEARPGEVEAATVDHGFRAESRDEAEAMARLCERLGVAHAILSVSWDAPPTSAIQEQARSARYHALAAWMRDRGLPTLLTGHHLDDQAETFVMRLNRGSGVKGLAGMRAISTVPGAPDLMLARPLLGWRRGSLKAVCAAEEPAEDPSNADPRHERVRVRGALADSELLDPGALARSASNLALADEALNWAVDREWSEAVTAGDAALTYSPTNAPIEIRRRIAARAVSLLASEGGTQIRGRELDRLLDGLAAGNTSTLRGVRCEGGATWRFTTAKPRRLAK